MQQFRHARSFRAPGGIKNATFSPRHDWTVTKNKKTGTRPLTVLIRGAIVQLEQRKRNKRNKGNRRKVSKGVPNPELE